MERLPAKVRVWDTYVHKSNGELMHFDIVAPEAIQDPETIYTYGRTYLAQKGQEASPLTAKECTFCHIDTLQPRWAEAIDTQGFFIIEMEGC